MSFFYLTAVKGEVPVHLLEAIAVGRLRYLKAVLKQEPLFYDEYLVEGSVYDNVGHFILCIVTIMHKNSEFSRMFLRTESDLFKRRLTALNAYETRSLAKKLLRSIKKLSTNPPYIDALKILCEHLMIKGEHASRKPKQVMELAQHVCTSTHTTECNLHNIRLNFKFCLPLIAKRQVELQAGIALIPCGKWKQYMTILFNTNLCHRLTKTNLVALNSDPRISELLFKLQGEISSMIQNQTCNNILLSKNVDKASKMFPPCMLNLHNNLRQRHRLSHMQRFYYSLFLKDIGMPVEEAVGFWKLEYQRNPNGSHTCSHSWEKDEKKFVYGIRHMYGLEGGRKNYTSVSCHQIEQMNSACCEGGCPFKVFEPSQMMNVLDINEDSVWSQISQLKAQFNFTSACMKYLESRCSNNRNCDIENISFNFTPVKYYLCASQNNYNL